MACARTCPAATLDPHSCQKGFGGQATTPVAGSAQPSAMTTIVVHHTPNRLRFERDGVGVAEADLSAHTIALTLGASARCDFALSLRGVEDAVGEGLCAQHLPARIAGCGQHAPAAGERVEVLADDR